jgi:anti-anti-sigma factor
VEVAVGAAEFSVEIGASEHRFVVRPVGDLDVDAMGIFDRAIDASMEVDPECIAIELGEVTHLDLDGLASLLRARAVASACDVPLRFEGPSDACQRLIRHGSLQALLGLAAS